MAASSSAAIDRELFGRAATAFAARRWSEVVALLGTKSEGCRDADVLRMLALSLSELGQPDAARGLLERALQHEPGSAVLHVNHASVLRRCGDLVAAEARLRQAIALDPNLAAAEYNLGNLLKSDARLGAALPHFARAVELAPEHIDAHIALAEVQKALGDVTSAVANFRSAIALRCEAGAAWWGIANLKTVALTEADRDRLDLLFASSASRREREPLGFARAHAHAQHSSSSLAWQTLVEANAFVAEARPFDAAAFGREIAASVAALATGGPARATAATGPVFIVGLPRSGSTLLEQMLAAHPALSAASELPDLRALIARQRKARGMDWRQTMGAADWRALGDEYLARTSRWRQRHSRHVDKLPDNFLRIDAILRMLPGARIIDCRRDARDTALSCLQQYFALGHEFSFGLDSIAEFNAGYRSALAAAAAAAPTQLHRVDYESLVADPRSTLVAVLDFLELPFDSACLKPEQVRREVRTASAAQVVEPVDRRGIGRWQRHREAFMAWDESGALRF